MLNTDYSPAAYAQQLQTKQSRLHNLLSEFNAPAPQVFASSEQHYRLRAEFRLWREGDKRFYAMFAPGDNRTPIFINTFPIGSTLINQLMPRLEAAWNASKALSDRLFQVEFLTTLSGEAMITLCYHRPLDEDWQAVAEQLASDLNVSIIGRSRGKRTVIGRDFVVEKLNVAGREFSYRQPYCGNGNFTLPLSTRVRKVLATEISKSSVNAALANLEDNQINNIELVRLSAEELTQALNGVREFRRLASIDLNSYAFGTVFVDPPRAGMDSDTCELVRRFDRILYISCNPETLAENIRQLSDTHQIVKTALFDQFPWTDHMESGVLLERK